MSVILVRILIVVLVFLVPLYVVFGVLRDKVNNKVVNSSIVGSNSKKVVGPIWDFRSVDTVKYSRDVAREKINDPAFDEVINEQVKNIANLGATHVAIGTPYDPEFVPFVKRWVSAARRNRLHVFFRGNLSGWEEWFGYKKLDKDAHIKGIEKFITENPELFEDGDVFTTCTECENGALGDPRQTGDVEEYRSFLIDEYRSSQKAFAQINKKVQSNYFSMNGDVAKLIMDKDTTRSLDGIVAIDHYVKNVDKLDRDITDLAERSGGKIILSEWGAPILDIHGNMSEAEQAIWVANAFEKLSINPNLAGVNYWTSYGSSTALWKNDGSQKEAVNIVHLYFTKQIERLQ